MKRYRDQGWLAREYYGLRKSGYEIAKECGVCPALIYRYLDRYQLKRLEMGKGTRRSEKTKAKMRAALVGRRNGENGTHWKGGRFIATDGYVKIFCPNHPHAKSGRYIPEHRLVMEIKLGRYLKDDEVVHHINGIRTDNRSENLSLFENRGSHQSFHRQEKIKEI